MYDHGADIYQYDMDMLDFSSNINPLGVPDSFKEALISGIDTFGCYPDYRYDALKGAISRYIQFDKDNIMVDNGSVELIHKVIGSGFKRLLIPTPTFSEYKKAALKSRMPVIEMQSAVNKDIHTYGLYEESIIKQAKYGDIILLCNPNNPTGHLIPKATMRDIAKSLEEIGAFLLIDEAFMELTMDLGIQSFIDDMKDFNNVMVIRAITKYFGLPGVRLGYGMTKNERVLKYLDRHLGPWQVNTAGVLAKDVFNDVDYKHQTSKWLQEEIDYMYNNLSTIEGLNVYKSKTIFHLIELENNLMTAYELKKRLIKKGILIRTPEGFNGLSHHYFRLAVKDKKSNKKLLELLEREVTQ